MTEDEREASADAALARYFEIRAAEEAARRVLARFRDGLSPRRTPRVPASAPPPARHWHVRARSFAPVLALALFALLVGLPRRDAPATVAIDTPDSVLVNGSRAASAHAGATLRATAPAHATIDALELALQPGATLEIQALPGRARTGRIALLQSAGEVVYRLDRTAGIPVAVEVPGGTVRVTGTVFRIRVTSADAEVSVAEGTVEVSGERTVALSAGRSQRLSASGALGPARTFNPLADPALSGASHVGTGASR